MRSATVTATSPRLVGGLPNWAGRPEMSTVRIFQSLRTTVDPLSVWNAPWPRLRTVAVLPCWRPSASEVGQGLGPAGQLLHREHECTVGVPVATRVGMVDPGGCRDRGPDPEGLGDLLMGLRRADHPGDPRWHRPGGYRASGALQRGERTARARRAAGQQHAQTGDHEAHPPEQSARGWATRGRGRVHRHACSAAAGRFRP